MNKEDMTKKDQDVSELSVLSELEQLSYTQEKSGEEKTFGRDLIATHKYLLGREREKSQSLLQDAQSKS